MNDESPKIMYLYVIVDSDKQLKDKYVCDKRNCIIKLFDSISRSTDGPRNI